MNGSITNMRSGRNSVAGFSLTETMIVVAVVAILGAMAAPTIGSVLRLQALNQAVQTVGISVRGARHAALSKNRTVRVRFNCPAANQMRVVEFVGNPAIDDDPNRCSEVAYPYPNPTPGVAPDIDGPVIRLPEDARFGALSSIEINTEGRVQRLTGCNPACVAAAAPATVAVLGNNGHETRTITITAGGQILLP
jgi:prepilin-type N-terminal cleavage/methylation domain-containing protein